MEELNETGPPHLECPGSSFFLICVDSPAAAREFPCGVRITVSVSACLGVAIRLVGKETERARPRMSAGSCVPGEWNKERAAWLAPEGDKEE